MEGESNDVIRRELCATIRVQRGIIWGLVAALLLAAWWLA